MELSFKQYLESKTQLRQAIDQTPVAVNEYEVRKYCSIALGESKDDAKIIGLKPKQKIIVEWRYDNINDPTIVNIKLQGVIALDETEEFETFWTTAKFKKWLARHTKG